MTRLNTLYANFGQSPWIDNIRRDWLQDGTLRQLVADGVRGVTSNPSIFAKALATSNGYDHFITMTALSDPEELFESLAVMDVADACDVLHDVHVSSREEFRVGPRRYLDGFVSLEVSPRLARDTNATISAAKRLSAMVNRDNLMVKIPATVEGLPAITQVLGAGINVNVTLIFSVERYGEVLDAWMDGIELALKNGRDIAEIASVASFFVSRVDVAVDALLEQDSPLRGTIANAQVCAAYALYAEKISSKRAVTLLNRGAQVQRPLWASTSTKNPSYDQLLYVDYIVGNETVNTMPDATLRTVLERGSFDRTYLYSLDSVKRHAARLKDLPASVSLDAVTAQLEREGVDAFVASYEELLDTVKKKMEAFQH